jgi:hypothetical protein
MSKLTDGQRKMFIGIAIIDGAIGLVLMGLTLADVINIPIFIPLLMLVSAAGVFIAGRQM